MFKPHQMLHINCITCILKTFEVTYYDRFTFDCAFYLAFFATSSFR